MKRLLLAALLLAGCSASPESRSATSQDAVTSHSLLTPPVRHTLARLEAELVLRLWLHLEKQRVWLTALLKNTDDDDAAEAIYLLRSEIEQQSRITWLAYLESSR
jgi:hypothetical protein